MGKRKNGNGEGTIYQRKDGTYCAQKVVDGRRVTGYGKNKTEAREKLAKNIKKAILNGNILPFHKVAEKHISDHHKGIRGMHVSN